jgi:hypothetical protein
VLEVVENWRDKKNKGDEPNHRSGYCLTEQLLKRMLKRYENVWMRRFPV